MCICCCLSAAEVKYINYLLYCTSLLSFYPLLKNRLRDCQNCRILLFSQTRPIIENSSGISFGCYDYDYFGFESNFVESKLDLWINRWFDVYDFNPSNTTSNFILLPSDVTCPTLLQTEQLEILAEERLTLMNKKCGLLRTCGVQNIH